MSQDQIVALLLGPLGLLVGSLLLNYLQAKGILVSRSVVPREQFEAQVAITASYATRWGEQTDAVKVLAAAVDKLPKRSPR